MVAARLLRLLVHGYPCPALPSQAKGLHEPGDVACLHIFGAPLGLKRGHERMYLSACSWMTLGFSGKHEGC
ncbi:hypothetical protein V6N11_077842 [Hibiscus sabdariffa]|uniref:Secreted protein n=1 Tax=Hibiscus sabdariffa TaxID=183260 RepID=A0ABR2TF69_9ROSI